MKNKIFIVTTTSDCTTEYRVEAKNEKEANKKFLKGDYKDSCELDFANEQIVSTTEI